MKRPAASLALSLMLVFASGVLVGALGYKSLAQPEQKKDNPPRTPEEFRKAYLAEMKARLKLSEDQVRKLNTILDETREKYRQLREKQRPEMKVIQDGQTSEINAMLSAEQQKEYAKMRREREEKKKAEKERGR
jgi:hypothetical protein